MVKMSSCSSNAGLETSASLVNAITDNALFHSSSHINQLLLQVVHILRFCLIDMLLWIRSGLFGGHKSGNSYA